MAADYASYKQIVGEITGLSLAIRDIEDLQQRQSEVDND